MIRLTLLLLAGLGIAMLVAGREPAPGEQAAVNPDRASVQPNRPAAPAVLASAEAPAVAPPDPAPVVSERSVDRAVQMAMSTDLLASPAPAAAPVAAEPAAGVVASSDNVGTGFSSADPVVDPAAEPASVADEIDAALTDSQIRYVNANTVNVREGPSTDYAVVGKVTYGEATEILSDPDSDWVRIRIQGDGVEGYVAARFLQDSEPGG